jgi:hypothetical protein
LHPNTLRTESGTINVPSKTRESQLCKKRDERQQNTIRVHYYSCHANILKVLPPLKPAEDETYECRTFALVRIDCPHQSLHRLLIPKIQAHRQFAFNMSPPMHSILHHFLRGVKCTTTSMAHKGRAWVMTHTLHRPSMRIYSAQQLFFSPTLPETVAFPLLSRALHFHTSTVRPTQAASLCLKFSDNSLSAKPTSFVPAVVVLSRLANPAALGVAVQPKAALAGTATALVLATGRSPCWVRGARQPKAPLARHVLPKSA